MLVIPPLHANFSQSRGLICLPWFFAEEVGCVSVEGGDVDPHAARLRVEGGQEGRSVGLREVSVLECR